MPLPLGQQYLNAANSDERNAVHAFSAHIQHFYTVEHEDGVESTISAAEPSNGRLTIVRTSLLQQLNALV